jgi:hypothetical protein
MVRLEGLGKLQKKSTDLIGTGTRDLPACSKAPGISGKGTCLDGMERGKCSVLTGMQLRAFGRPAHSRYTDCRPGSMTRIVQFRPSQVPGILNRCRSHRASVTPVCNCAQWMKLYHILLYVRRVNCFV